MEEASQPLTIESFSYRWLINLKPSLESLDDASDEASFIEMDPKMTPSKRFLGDAQDFNFNIPLSQSPLTLVHADELFSNGLLMPLFLNPSKMEAFDSSDSVPTPLISSEPSSSSNNRIHSSFLRRCLGLSRRIFQKHFGFLTPSFRKAQDSRFGTRAETIDARAWLLKSRRDSKQISPTSSVAYYSSGDWLDMESSIREAVLHCKK